MARYFNLDFPRRITYPFSKYTIRIIHIWPDYETMKADLILCGMKEEDINEIDYRKLIALGGKFFIKWIDSEQARLSMAYSWIEHFNKRKINQQIWDMSLEKLMGNNSSQENYITGESDSETNIEFKSSAIRMNSQGSILNNSTLVDQFLATHMEPTFKMFNDFISTVSLPIQPEPDYKYQDDGTNFNTDNKW